MTLYGYKSIRPEALVTVTMARHACQPAWLAWFKTAADAIEHLCFTAVGLVGLTLFLYLTGMIALAGPAGMLAGFVSFATWAGRR